MTDEYGEDQCSQWEARQMRAEIEWLRAALKELFLLAQMSNEIRNDCRQMRNAGKLLAGHEQKARSANDPTLHELYGVWKDDERS